MAYKEVTYPIKACPFCGYSAEAKLGETFGSQAWYIQCTKCHIKTLPVFIDSTYFYGGKEVKYSYYDALKEATDVWNKRVGD